jgi:hypothetical protein
VGTRRNGLGDLHEVQVHRLGVAGGQDQSRAFALLRADRPEDVGLADTSLVCKPDFYVVAVERLRARDCLQARGETYGMARPSLPAR